MVLIGDSVQAHLWSWSSGQSLGIGLPYLWGSCPLFGSGKFLYVFGDWLLARLKTFPAGGESFSRFPNTGESVRLTYLAGLYIDLLRSSEGISFGIRRRGSG